MEARTLGAPGVQGGESSELNSMTSIEHRLTTSSGAHFADEKMKALRVAWIGQHVGSPLSSCRA